MPGLCPSQPRPSRARLARLLPATRVLRCYHSTLISQVRCRQTGEGPVFLLHCLSSLRLDDQVWPSRTVPSSSEIFKEAISFPRIGFLSLPTSVNEETREVAIFGSVDLTSSEQYREQVFSFINPGTRRPGPSDCQILGNWRSCLCLVPAYRL